MRLFFLVGVIGVSGIAAGIAACGDESNVDPVVQQVDDAGADVGADTGEPVEQMETTFPCGAGNTCNVGQHACCQVGTAFACFPVAGGCPIVDAGSDAEASAPPPLLCTTYNNCNNGNDCCYHPDAGSRCMNSCPNGYENLCRPALDGCGDGDCQPLPNPPLAGLGRCVPD